MPGGGVQCSTAGAAHAAVAGIQHEHRDLDLEALAIGRHAEVAAVHGAAGRAQAAAAGVLEGFARCQQRLLAHHAQALDLLGVAARVVDDPVARDQLRRHLARVVHGDGVGKAIQLARRLRFVRQKLGLDLDPELVFRHATMVTARNAGVRG